MADVGALAMLVPPIKEPSTRRLFLISPPSRSQSQPRMSAYEHHHSHPKHEGHVSRHGGDSASKGHSGEGHADGGSHKHHSEKSGAHHYGSDDTEHKIAQRERQMGMFDDDKKNVSKDMGGG